MLGQSITAIQEGLVCTANGDPDTVLSAPLPPTEKAEMALDP
jgi:hypothetical protein